MNFIERCQADFTGNSWPLLTLFHDLLSRSYVYHSLYSVIITAHNFTPAKHDESILGDVHCSLIMTLNRGCREPKR